MTAPSFYKTSDKTYRFLTDEQVEEFNTGVLVWKHADGLVDIQAPLTYTTNADYVVSHRSSQHVVAFRPRTGATAWSKSCATHAEAFAAAAADWAERSGS